MPEIQHPLGRHFPNNEGGSIIVLTIFAVVCLLALGGLAVDAGNLYHARQTLQKAADNGALAALAYTVRRGMNNTVAEVPSGGCIADYLVTKADEVARANVVEARLSGDNDTQISVSGTLTANFDQSALIPSCQVPTDPNPSTLFTLSVTVTRPIDFHLIDLVPFDIIGTTKTGSKSTLSATASVKRVRANTMVALDFSDSMNCPVAGSCDCLRPNRSSGCPRPSKLDNLVDAAKVFIKRFDYNFDNLVLIPFNLAARDYSLQELVNEYRSVYPSSPMNSIPNLQNQDIDTLIDYLRSNYPARNSTNICDALIRTYGRITNVPQLEQVSLVLFSDGPPTAGRFLLANVKTSSGIRSSNAYGFGNYDYSHSSIAYSNSNSYWFGPSLLEQTGGWNFTSQNVNLTHPFLPAGCGPNQAPSVVNNSTSEIANAAQSALSPCLQNLGFSTPNRPGTPAPTNPTVYGSGTNPDDPGFVDWRKQYYNCSIVYSDFIRNQRGKVYVIALGTPEASPSTIYGDLDDTWSRKDRFLARVANDYISARLSQSPPFPEPNFTNYSSYENWNSSSDPRQGTALFTNDANQLNGLFDLVAEQILLTLTS